MSEIYRKVGEHNYSQILADPEGADVVSIPCKPGSGEVEAGTVMYREASGLYSPADSAQVTDASMLVILAEAADTGEAPASGETATAEDAAAYRTGRFVKGAVKLKAGAEVTAAHQAVLRKQGIVFDVMEDTATFNNTVTGS